MIRILGFALYGPLAASTRYRLEQFIPGLRAYGIELELVYLLNDRYLERRYSGRSTPWIELVGSGIKRLYDLVKLYRYDLGIVHCELFPMLPGPLESALMSRPYIYDFDDAFFLKYKKGDSSFADFLLGNKFASVIGRAAAVNAGNQFLKSYALNFNRRAEFIPTVVDMERYSRRSRICSDIFTVGWIGSPSTAPYLKEIESPLRLFAREGKVRLVVIGGASPKVEGVEVVELPWSADTEIELINSFDVGIMPLTNDDWARGKCAFKIIQYLACGIPVIATDIGANRSVVTSECGFLASSAEDWLSALRYYRDNPCARRLAGEAGRHRVSEVYSLEAVLPKFASQVFRAVGG